MNERKELEHLNCACCASRDYQLNLKEKFTDTRQWSNIHNMKNYELTNDDKNLNHQIKPINLKAYLHHSPNDRLTKMNNLVSYLILVFNLFILLSTCLPVNSLNVNSLSNSTLNQLTNFNNYYGSIQIQYQTINETINFTHTAYDPNTGKLYIGSINNLLQLNSDLIVEQQYQTGKLIFS